MKNIERKFFVFTAVVMALVFAGCSATKQDDTSSFGKPVNAEDFFPLVMNATWSKQVKKDTAAGLENSSFSETIIDTTSVDGKFYYVFQHGDGSLSLYRIADNTLYIVETAETATKNAFKKSYISKAAVNESQLFLFGVQPGATWPIGSGSKDIENGSVSWITTGRYKGFEDVFGTPKAGPFIDCAVIEITNTITTKNLITQSQTTRIEKRTVWLAKGIGIVKETNVVIENDVIISTETEEALSYFIPSTPASLALSGTIADSLGKGVAGVIVNIGGFADTTFSTGAYNITDIPKGKYTIIPSKENYIFIPDSLSVEIENKVLSNLNFTAVYVPRKFIIAGTVSDSTGAGIHRVVMTLSDGETDTTAVDGTYSFRSVTEGTYVLKPFKTGYTFSPDSLNIDIKTGDSPGNDFKGTAPGPMIFTVSGIAADSTGAGISGALVTLSDNRTFTTGENGFFTFTETPNGDYTIIVTKEGWVFDPEKLFFVVDGKDVILQAINGKPLPPVVFSVSGVITDSENKGIPNVSVLLSEAGKIAKKKAQTSVLTDSLGAYIFTGVKNGAYVVTPSLDGYEFSPQSINVTVSGADASSQNFTGAKIKKFYSVSGTVKNQSGQGLESAVLSLSDGKSDTTAADGSYKFEGVAEGAYLITPALEGYTFSPENITADVKGGDITGMDFTAIPVGFTISGFVKDSAGNAITGASAVLAGAPPVLTGGNGEYSFTGLSNGQYTVKIKLEGYTFSPDSLVVVIDNADAGSVNFTGTLIKPVKYSVTGIITDSGGKGISGITVNLSGGNLANGLTTGTDDNGSYAFKDLDNGSYTVTPSSDKYVFTPESANVTISGADAGGVNFTAKTIVVLTYVIAGRITDSSNNGVSGVLVSLSDGRSYLTTESGNYTFGAVVNGSYSVSPSKEGYTFTPTSRNVVVSGADMTGIDFNATAFELTYSLSGTVTNAAGAPVQGVNISLSTGNSASTNADGYYIFSGLKKGTYSITPSMEGYTFDPSGRTVEITSENISGQGFKASPVVYTHSVSGVVTDSAGKGIEGVLISLESGKLAAAKVAKDALTVLTDASGAYSFGNLQDGSYIITPSKTEYIFSPQSSQITLAGQNLPGINFTGAVSAKTFTVSGKITLSGGQAGIAEVTVVLEGETDENVSVSQTVTTSGNGNYVFENISNGKYNVSPALTGYSFTPATAAVTVSGANAGGVNFTGNLAPQTHAVSGKISDDKGSGIENIMVELVPAEPAKPGASLKAVQKAAVTAYKQAVSGGNPGKNAKASGETVVYTDKSGFYSFTEVDDGAYTIIPVSGDWTFTPPNLQILVNGQDVTGQNFTASPLAPQTFSISGNVLDSLGKGIAGAVVYVTQSGAVMKNSSGKAPFKVSAGKSAAGSNVKKNSKAGDETNFAATNSTGFYTVSGIINGNYVVTPVLEGFEFMPQSQQVTVNGQDIAGINFTGVKPNILSNISGTITDISGNPVRDVLVSITGKNEESSGQPLKSVYTGENGFYSIDSIPNGEYIITPLLAGYNFSPGYIELTAAGQDITEQNFTASPQGAQTFSISGNVLDSFGNGIAGAVVYVTQSGAVLKKMPVKNFSKQKGQDSGGNDSGTGIVKKVSKTGENSYYAVTDTTGFFVVDGVPNGTYDVIPEMAGFVFSPLSHQVTVNGQNVTSLVFTALPQGHSVSGYLYSSTNAPVSGVTVTLSTGMSAVSSSSGLYTFENVTDGQYSVTPDNSVYNFSPGVMIIIVEGADITGVNFTIVATTFSISGFVKNAAGSPINGVEVYLSISGGDEIKYFKKKSAGKTAPFINTAITDGSGYYSFGGLANGTYIVSPSKDGYTFEPSMVEVNTNFSSQSNINFTGTHVSFTVSGYVKTGVGAGIDSVYVVLGQIAGVYTDNSGYYFR